MAIDYRAWLEGAKAELSELQGQKSQIQAQQAELRNREQEIDARINGMAQTVSGLASLVPDESLEPSWLSLLRLIGKTMVDVGLTARIRAILQAAGERWMGLSAIEVRSELQRAGFYAVDSANLLSNVYTILGRLVKSGEAEEFQGLGGEKRFRWKEAGAAPGASLGNAPSQRMATLSTPVRKVAYRRGRRSPTIPPVAPTVPSKGQS
ncbi:MAG: hypothetical protein ABSC05_38815 [Candidatus Solibacter sp.]|jgi:hypothetical protein